MGLRSFTASVLCVAACSGSGTGLSGQPSSLTTGDGGTLSSVQDPAKTSSQPLTGPFKVIGSKIFDAAGNWIVFRGIGLTCTEYMTRPMFPLHGSSGSAGGDWPGKFGWENCFVGKSGPNSTDFELNAELDYMMAYLLTDVRGGSFVTAPKVQRVQFDPPWAEVIDSGSPMVVPIVRLPVTSGSYLYDEECNDVGAAGYRRMVDLMVQYLTGKGVAVIIDQHGCCAEGGKLKCAGDGKMAQAMYGNYSGAGAFWDLVASTYANNSLVLYELKNEPYNIWYQAWYGGDSNFNYIGMADMLDIVRNRTGTGLVIVESTDWGHDANFPIAFYLQYSREHNNTPPSNILYSLHPYKGMYQGNEKALRGTLRLTLALKQIGPVIYTEFGQYCCNAGEADYCESKPQCDDHAHGDWFVYNTVNMATQYDVSWVGWAWRGTGSGNGHNCTNGMTQCGTPDMRDNGPVDASGNATGVLSSGIHGGANWTDVWSTFVSAPTLIVQDSAPNVHLNGTAYEPKGYLPRPCIVGQFGLGGFCGYPLGSNSSVWNEDWNSFWNGTQGNSVLPGLPPSQAACTLQACPGWTCNTTAPTIPQPHPCSADGCN